MTRQDIQNCRIMKGELCKEILSDKGLWTSECDFEIMAKYIRNAGVAAIKSRPESYLVVYDVKRFMTIKYIYIEDKIISAI